MSAMRFISSRSLPTARTLMQHELALGEAALGEVDHLDHLDQAVEVLGDLLDDLVGAGGHDRHARQRGVLGGRHGQALDVVAAGRKQRHDARQGTGLVLEQDGDDVLHDVASCAGSRARSTGGSTARPAGRL
jgi:hypothetical protein